MNKALTISLLICLFLTSCNQSDKPFSSYEEAQNAIISLNVVFTEPLHNENNALLDKQLPFTDEYLKHRNTLYNRLMQTPLTSQQTHQLNYLVIAQRFPERYFSWPAQSNILANMLILSNGDDDAKKIKSWLAHVQQQLENAGESNLKLNKIELTYLKQYTQNAIASSSTPIDLQPALIQLNRYFEGYLPRASIGLYGLANGGQWYQSKLNYFSNRVHSPLQWLTIINEQLKNKPRVSYQSTITIGAGRSFMTQFLFSNDAKKGLDWQTGYQQLPTQSKNKILSAADTVLLLALMETDLGIHYHAWTLPQAHINLRKRLEISMQDADELVKDIVLYPGQSFSFAQQLLDL